MPHGIPLLRPLCVLALVLCATTAGADGTSLSLLPSTIQVLPGAEFTVRVELPVAGDPINGYDAVVGFDPTRLEVLLPVPASGGEGALFTAACPQRFLDVRVAGDSTQVSVAHVLLCAGATVTGPGELYELRFRARSITGVTWLRLIAGTAAYDAGSYVEPLTTADAQVLVGTPTSAPPAAAAARRLWASPNPFNPRTELRFDAGVAQSIQLELFDVAGRSLGEIYRGRIPAGPFRHTWNARTADGRALASGAYFVRLRSSTGHRFVARLLLLR